MAEPTTQVNRQIGEKPLGYAGDYIVANYFYEDGYSGTSLYGMFMDRYTVDSPLARAHINRRSYLGRFIEKKAKLFPGGTLNVCSFACGPAPEVFDTFDKGVSNVRFTLVDAEPGVIELLKNKLNKYKEQKKHATIHHANIINLLRRSDKLHIPEQDIIYCAGFFDYIREATATKCIRYMLNHLRSNGWLVVVNVSMDDVKNVYLKMLGEWELYHRSKKELLSLVDNVEGLRQKKVWSDYYTKRNLYLVMKKA
jgi:extracellular factor (EF) 3-hydroxypalmitic acid methyl ester biosynthesis protein